MKISIVIRSYNEARHLPKLLAGLAAQRLRADEVILVDSGSTDGTPEIAAQLGARVVGIDKREFTFGRALNVGCDAATGDILVFVSAHVYPTYDNWLERLVAPFADARVVLSYGRQRGDAVNKFSEHRIFERWFPSVGEPPPQRSYFCNNANCAVRRLVWQQQRYDETLTGLEDLAWAKQAQHNGGWLAYCSDAEIIHVHEETWEQVQNRYRREAIAMRHIDNDARFSLWDFVRLMVSNVAADSRVALSQGVFRKELPSILGFRFNQLWGTYKGYNGVPEVSAELRQRFYFPLSHQPSDNETAMHDGRQIDYESIQVVPYAARPETPSRAARAGVVQLR